MFRIEGEVDRDDQILVRLLVFSTTTGKLESLQIVVPHEITVLQDAAPRTFTTLYTIKRQMFRVSRHTILTFVR